MADLLQQGDQFIADMRKSHVSRDVTYEPAAGGSVGVAATIGRTMFEVSQVGEGMFEPWESRDFIIAVGDLAAEPKEGDIIKEPIGATHVATYKVLAPRGVPGWKWCDASRTGYRIHTKHQRTEAA